MNEFRASDKVGYHTFLKRHILPELFNSRDDYYANLLSEYTLCCEIGGENFAYNAVISDVEINETAKEINEQSHLLRRAVDDISLLKTPLLNLNPELDLKDIIDGKTAVKLSKKSYFDLCKYAKSKGERLVVFQLSKADYTHEYVSGGDQIHHLAHSCYYKNNVCHLTKEVTELDRDIANQLYAIGNNLNQVSRRANSMGVINVKLFSESVKNFENIMREFLKQRA